MRSTSTALAVASLSLATLFGGCGKSEVVTPTACLQGVANFEKALGNAPNDVALPGGVKISECLVRNQKDGDLINVGDTLRIVATDLSKGMTDKALSDPSDEIKAGYLVGAVEKGAEETEGIHATLVQRVSSAATNSLTPAGKADFDRGYAAGKEDG